MHIENLGQGKFKVWYGEKPTRIRVPKPKFIIWEGEKIELKYKKHTKKSPNTPI